MYLFRTLTILFVAGFMFTGHAAAAAPPVQPLVIGESWFVASAVLGEQRRINVYRPAGIGADVPLPVLYIPDGGVAEDFLHVAGLLQVGAANMTLRPFLLVGIENTERRRDLTGPTDNAKDRSIAPRVGGSAAFRSFLRNELMPQVAQRYRITTERAIVGESLAGLFVIETLVQEPDLFDTSCCVCAPLLPDLLLVTGLALIGYAVIHFDAQTATPGWHAAIPCAGAALIIAAGRGARLAHGLLANAMLTGAVECTQDVLPVVRGAGHRDGLRAGYRQPLR